mgnify:CR=1 FL=1
MGSIRPKSTWKVKKWWKQIKQRPGWVKLLNWEYWPSVAFYWPMTIAGPLMALRAKHPCFFTAANPGLHAGGVGLESKFQTLDLLPESYQPQSILARPGESFDLIESRLLRAGITFPLIAKPDIGYRGFLVRKLDSPEELENYLQSYHIDFIIQEYLDYPEEVGIFYYRLPGERRGKVVSLTLKKFLYISGDGHSTVRELIERKPRALLQLEDLEKTRPDILSQIPDYGEKVPLSVIGNHCKGTQFINGNQFIDDQLCDTFDQISRNITGFHYGRFDVKCQSLEALKAGREFKIIELNGAFSEPTHIYDAQRSTYWQALRTIVRHWRIVRQIATANHAQGVPFMRASDMLSELRALKDYHRKIKMALERDAVIKKRNLSLSADARQ